MRLNITVSLQEKRGSNNCMKLEMNVMTMATGWEAGRCCREATGHLQSSVRKDLMVWRRDTVLGWNEALPSSRGWWLPANHWYSRKEEQKESHQAWGQAQGQEPASSGAKQWIFTSKWVIWIILLGYYSATFPVSLESTLLQMLCPVLCTRKKKIEKKTEYSAKSKNSKKICKFLSITWCTWNTLFFSSSAIAENSVEHRATGDKQWKCLMARRKRAEKIGMAGLGRKQCVHNMM